MVTIYRIVHPCGWVEFIDLTKAEEYRGEHHPGMEIQELQRDLSAIVE